MQPQLFAPPRFKSATQMLFSVPHMHRHIQRGTFDGLSSNRTTVR
jgi:hypothetical protein